MSQSLQKMLDLRPDCDMTPDKGTHNAKAVIRVRISKPGWAKPQEANLCKPHIKTFMTRARNNGLTVETIKDYTKKEGA